MGIEVTHVLLIFILSCLRPFISVLSQQEHSALSQRLREIPSQPINLENDELRVHGRSWTKEYMDALRVAHLDNLPLDRFFPPDYIPGDTDPGTLKQINN